MKILNVIKKCFQDSILNLVKFEIAQITHYIECLELEKEMLVSSGEFVSMKSDHACCEILQTYSLTNDPFEL